MLHHNKCLGAADILVGLQWGDEGKGKFVDTITNTYDWVVRFQGGSNAGHTVYFGGNKYVLHMIPTGILRENCKVIISNGCVINPDELIKEIEELEKLGLSLEGRLFISDKCHLTLTHHLQQDIINKSKFGSTGKGIGPTYRDKVNRAGVRLGDVTSLESVIKLNKFKTNTESLLRKILYRGENVLFEGAQGTLLDIDFGSYPDVTSSNCVAQYVPVGTGLSLSFFKNSKIYGIAKSYATRIGTGPFPSEIKDEKLSTHIRTIGDEFGATTGRPRRIGWMDLDLLKDAIELNGVTDLIITKLDVLSQLVSFDVKAKNSYLTFHTKGQLIQGQTDWLDLPSWAKDYIKLIETFTNTNIKYIGTGRDRSHVITLR